MGQRPSGDGVKRKKTGWRGRAYGLSANEYTPKPRFGQQHPKYSCRSVTGRPVIFKRTAG